MVKRFSGANLFSAAVILAGSLARILSYRFSANTGGDALARVGVTAMWLQHPDLRFVFGSYPPGHSWLIAAFTLIFRDVVVAGRVLSLVLGIASLFVVSRLARLLYGDTAGVLSLVAFSLYTVHIAYSTTSSSEVGYLFFLLFGLLLFFSALSQGSGVFWKLGAAGIALSISESIRFEAWLFFFGMVAILALSRMCKVLPQGGDFPNRRSILVFGVTGALWPLLMMVYCWRHFHDPMYLVTQNHLRVLSELSTTPLSLGYLLALSPAAIAISLSVPVVVAALYGLVLSFRSSSRVVTAFAALGILFAAVQNYQILRHGMIANARYTLTMGTILAIVSGLGMETAFQKFRTRLTLTPALLIGFLIANNAIVLAISKLPVQYSEKLASVSPVLRYPHRIEDVANFLRAHLRANDAVVVDSYNVESNVVAYAAGLPLLSGQRAYLANTKYDLSARDYIAAVHPQFMVYSDLGTLRDTFKLPYGCSQDTILNNIEFHCVFSGNVYRVYELRYH